VMQMATREEKVLTCLLFIRASVIHRRDKNARKILDGKPGWDKLPKRPGYRREIMSTRTGISNLI
jgi:hypothetical protein